MKNKKYGLLVSLVIVVVFLFSISFVMAKDAEDTVKTGLKSVNWNDPLVEQDKILLVGYYTCSAAVKNNLSECDNLKSSHDKYVTCKNYYNTFHRLLGKVAVEGRVSNDFVTECSNSNEFKYNSAQCQTLGEVFLRGDTSVCKDENGREDIYCKAFISGDASNIIGNDVVANKAMYLNALKKHNVNLCDKLDDPILKIMCQGAVSKDVKICEKDPNFLKFIKRHGK